MMCCGSSCRAFGELRRIMSVTLDFEHTKILARSPCENDWLLSLLDTCSSTISSFFVEATFFVHLAIVWQISRHLARSR